jgi:hypothetical protein
MDELEEQSLDGRQVRDLSPGDTVHDRSDEPDEVFERLVLSLMFADDDGQH